MKYIFLIPLLLLFYGCKSLEIPVNFKYKEIYTTKFKFATYQKITKKKEPIFIFIEGDGNSFDSKNLPTKNPTPKSTNFRKLAFSANSSNIVYIARVCQFVKDEKCLEKYWTTSRFSKDVIDSTIEAIEKIAQNNKIILVGFSGGAQIAGLVATNSNLKVAKLITIAGNLDHKTWTSYHKILPLRSSMDLNDFKKEYLKIPQIHYISQNDKIIPPFITKKFLGSNKNIIIIPNIGHNYDWSKVLVIE